MNLNVSLNKFNFGEADPLILARDDYDKYSAGCKRLENFIPLVQGAVQRRGGTKFVTEVKNSDENIVLLGFEASQKSAYIIEVGNKYMRFIYNNEYVKNDVGDIYELKTTYLNEHLKNEQGISQFKTIQSLDTVFIVNPNYAPMKLKRVKHNSWTITALGGWNKGNAESIAIFRERLVLSVSDTLYFSATGAFENFNIQNTADPKPDEPITITIYSEQFNRIVWLVSSKNLLVGTAGGEFVVKEATTYDPFGVGNVQIAPQTNYGSNSLQAIRIGAINLFCQRTGQVLREFMYDFNGDSYKANDLTVTASHIATSGLICMAWQNDPHTIVWSVRADGALIGFTYDREQNMSAWHRHTLGGNGKAKSLAIITTGEAQTDVLYLLVERTINGVKKQYIEYLTQGLTNTEEQEKAFYVDCGKTFKNNDYVSELTGLEHLEAQEVAIYADGALHPVRLVKDGKITLQGKAKVINVGLPYVSLLETLPLELPLPDGSARGRKIRIVKAGFRFFRSLGGRFGTPNSQENSESQNKLLTDYKASQKALLAIERMGTAKANNIMPFYKDLTLIETRRGDDKTNTNVPLFSGFHELAPPSGGHRVEQTLVLIQNEPAPLTVLGIYLKVKVEMLSQ